MATLLIFYCILPFPLGPLIPTPPCPALTPPPSQHHTAVLAQTPEFFNVRSTILGSSFQYIHKSIDIGGSILYLRAFFSREGLHSFLHILKENHKP